MFARCYLLISVIDVRVIFGYIKTPHHYQINADFYRTNEVKGFLAT